MSTASKDPKINDLFTEGSHHRNLSVVVLNQNLYFGRDPTQRRNCQYMILFNNPIDKLQVMTLAKQMYPGNSNYFMKKFNEAVTVPFGHLLIDLKAIETTWKHFHKYKTVVKCKEWYQWRVIVP